MYRAVITVKADNGFDASAYIAELVNSLSNYVDSITLVLSGVLHSNSDLTTQKLREFIMNIETLPAQVKNNIFLIVTENDQEEIMHLSDATPICNLFCGNMFL